MSEREDETPRVPPAPVESPPPREEPPAAHDDPGPREEPPPSAEEPTAPREEPPVASDVPPDDRPASAETDAGSNAESNHEPASELVEARSQADVDRELARLSRRGFLTLAAGATAGVLGWRWMTSRPRENNQPWPFRRVLQANEALWEGLWDPTRLSPTYARSRADRNPRVNGRLGLDQNADLSAWRLNVEGAAAGPLALTLADVQGLPPRELITELRCIEGWSIVVHWTGVRLSDFIARYPPAARDGSAADPRRPERMPPFVALETPGRGYYVGLDLQSALHPQTLLAYAINDAPLSWLHGAPVRLVAPMKYGVKNLKRIGTLRYTFVRPTDYWYERGYDWYLGH